MTKNIYYITRSYYPYQKGGGPLIRTSLANNLQQLGWNIMVIMPNYTSLKLIEEDNIIQIPFKHKHIQKIASIMERIGFYEDYLDKWVANAYIYLKDKITAMDFIFSTSGGELGMIKLGSLLTDNIGCKFIINFNDPINYGYMKGLRRDKKIHIGREKAHEKYMLNADLIFTSSKSYRDIIKERFSSIKDIIFNNYFGYIKAINTDLYIKKDSNKLRIAYTGMMSITQKPELLYEAFKLLKDDAIELYFIGDIKKYRPLQNIKDSNIFFIDYLEHNEFLKFMCENIDVGFVSLANDYYGACVPSKIYEYINLELPMIGALPKGDARNIINYNNYGIAINYDDIIGLSEIISKYTCNKTLKEIKKTIIYDKNNWKMSYQAHGINKLLKELL